MWRTFRIFSANSKPGPGHKGASSGWLSRGRKRGHGGPADLACCAGRLALSCRAIGSRAPLLAFCLVASSCQVTTAATSVVGGSVACARSEEVYPFPEQGEVRDVTVAFEIVDGDDRVAFSHVGRCEYQGSLCGGGAWFQVWYGDQDAVFEWSLSNGDRLVYRPHTQCTYLGQYLVECSDKDCDAAGHFKLNLDFSQERAALLGGTGTDWASGLFPGSVVASISEMGEYDLKLEAVDVRVSPPRLDAK